MNELAEFSDVEDGEYVRVRDLPRGGFGEVYVARDPAGQLVVVKELRVELQEELGTRFAREPALAGSLDDRRVVRVLRKGRWKGNGRLFYAMEYVRGPSLAAEIDRTDVRRRLELLPVLRETALAVSHAHRRGVVHRDLKPANVVVSENGPVVIDWGLAGHVGDSLEVAGSDLDETGLLTRAGAGTVFYVSPEQAAGSPASTAMDNYSLGAMLYEFLVGLPPYRSGTPIEGSIASAFYIALESGPPAAPVLKNLPARVQLLSALCMKSLSHDPDERVTAEALAAELEPWGSVVLCAHCNALADRASATPVDNRLHICAACTLKSLGRTVFDPFVEHVRPILPVVPSGAATNEGSTSAAPARLDAAMYRRAETSSSVNGVRVTAASDDLDRAVVLVEPADSSSASSERVDVMARALAKINGRSAPLIYASGRWSDGGPVLVLEDLGDAFRDAVEAPPTLAALRDVAQLLTFLHREGYVHGALESSAIVSRGSERGALIRWEHTETATPITTSRDRVAFARIVADHPKASSSLRGIAVSAQREPAVQFDKLTAELVRTATNVRCVTCGKIVSLAHVNITGNGYLCASCSRTVDLSSAGTHISANEHRSLRSGFRFFGLTSIVGVACVVGVMLALSFIQTESRSSDAGSGLAMVLPIAVAILGGPIVLAKLLGIRSRIKMPDVAPAPTVTVGKAAPRLARIPPASPLLANDTEPMTSVSSKFSNKRAAEAVRAGERALGKSDGEANAEAARRRRLQGIMLYVEAVQQGLYQRLRTAIPPGASAARAWLEQRESKEKKAGAERALDMYLSEGALPELTTIAQWLRKPPLPEALGREIARALAVPSSLEKWLFELGAVRNVLAHRAQYESQPERDLGAAKEVFSQRTDQTSRVLDIPPEAVERIRERSRQVLRRTSSS